MKRVKLIVGASLLFAATAASAQTDPDPAAPPPPDGTAAPAVVTTTAPGAWSEKVIDQPMTLQAGKIAVYGNLDVARISVSDGMGNSASATSEGLDLGIGYGVNDKLTVGLNYAFALHDFEIKGPLTLFGAYSLYNKDKLTIGASANLTIDFNGTVDAMGNSSTSETLQAGLGVRYKATDKIAIYTGGGSSGFGLANETPRAGGILGQHLSIGLNSNAPITFAIPVGVGIQAAPNAFLWANTAIASISISNSNTEVLFADYIPLNVGIDYSVDQHLEVGAFLTLPDLKEAQFDLLFFGVGARYYN